MSLRFSLPFLLLLCLAACDAPKSDPAVETPAADTLADTGPMLIDSLSGLIIADGYEDVRNNCLACHSSKLITQQGMNREGWLTSIRWMQKKHGLWQLDSTTEASILSYLASYYNAPPALGIRRPPLEVVWDDEVINRTQ